MSNLIDRFNRRLNYLRISITDRCNLRCTYCMPEDLVPKLRHEDILTYEEILRVAKIGIGLGISKVRVTGGEPLVRKGVYEFLEELSGMEGLSDISITTNAVLLKENIERIRSIGIKRINISLDTLNPRKYKKITGFDKFDEVWKGIEAAKESGFHPIKLNVVARRGMNDDELIDIARLSMENPYHIRFIEYMPIGMHGDAEVEPLLTPEIKERIANSLGELIPVEISANDGPAERYHLKGARGEVGFISALSHHFCGTCNRLRLTASGQLRSCLLSDKQYDLKELLRNEGTDNDLAGVFLAAVKHKPPRHQVACPQSDSVSSHMSSIGG